MMYKLFFNLSFLWFTAVSVDVSLENKNPINISSKQEKKDQSYGQLLAQFVSKEGKVNYQKIAKNPKELNDAIFFFKENTPQNSWSNSKKLAYWINAYNVFTIKLIIDNYPVTSIKSIGGGKPWDKKFISLEGKTMSLNDIENGIIRKQFGEPRIHFAVNCASISCPKLANQPYTSDNLNTLLDKQAKRYINDSNENIISGKSIQLSSIFDWYKEDFSDGVIPFINKYSNSKIRSDAKITYKNYNWALNE